MRPVIVLFAKAPVPGRVKTRLQTRLAPSEAAQLHVAMVRDMIETLLHFAVDADIELHTDVVTQAWSDLEIPRRLQGDGNLGQRMYRALETALGRGRSQATIVGSDAVALPQSHMKILLGSSRDVALGPAEDGGYYAIACRRVHPAMFEGVHWSGPSALEETAGAARGCGLTVELGPSWFDVDRPEDLDRIASLSDLPRHVGEWLRRNKMSRSPEA